ncbi:MAG: transporter substrate-binding domain-containing protein [Bacteroidota bacterium]
MNHLKLFSLFFLFSTYALSQGSFVGQSWQSAKEKGSGKVSVVYYEGTGMVYKENGKMKGLCVDILNDFSSYVEKNHGVDLIIDYEKKESDWGKFLNTVQNSEGGVLGLSNVTITSKRKKVMDFTPPFISNPMIMLTHKSAPMIDNMKDLDETYKGYSGIVVGGTTHVNYMKAMKAIHYKDLPIEYGDSPAEVMTKVSKNPKMFTVVDLTEYHYATTNKLEVKRQPVSVSDNREELGFIMPKGSDWTSIWNEFLTPEYKKGGRYREIVSKNLGAKFLALL